jgi:4-amino-4-deoxy-L-arabinose transferase-like glycosyltransferase
LRDKSLFLIVLLLATSRFYDLGFGEVQGWDEALYAIRARSILLFGDWCDQTIHSVGGLYSAAHPPLYIWLTAISMKLFGDTAFTIRLWSAAFGAATVLILFYLPKDRLSGFFSAFIMGTSSFFSFYSRQGQLDVIYTFFLLLGIWFFIRLEDSGERKWLVAAGAAFGFALMSKIAVGLFLPMILVGYLLFQVIRRTRDWKNALLVWSAVVIIGLILAAPWHIYMFWIHGREFVDYYFLFHIIQRSMHGVELNIRALGPLFFANQIIVILSAATAIAFWRMGRIDFRKKDPLCLVLFLFLVPFIIFTLSRTQLRTYAIPMLPPLALLAGHGMRDIWVEDRVNRIVFSLTVIFSVWASSQALRNSVKQLFKTFRPEPVIFIAAAAAGILILLTIRRVTGRIFTFCVLCVLLVFSFHEPVEYTRSRIAEAADRFERENCRSLVYVDEVRVVHNPQISYYFDGVDLGWREDYRFRLIKPDETNDLDLPTVDEECVYIVINQRSQHREFLDLERKLQEEALAELLIEDDHYHIYRTRDSSF